MEKYPQSYMDNLVRQVTDTFENDFSQFFERKQTQEAEDKLKEKVNYNMTNSIPLDMV